MSKLSKGVAMAAMGLSVVLVSANASAAAAKKAKAAAKSDVVWPADAVKWEDGPIKGTKVAKLWGDWMKGGPYGVLVKFDAGLMNPLHHHSQSLKTIVVSGTFSFTPEGGTETKLGPGSYLLQAGGKKHVSGCAPGADCVFFMTSADKFDMTMDDGSAPAAEKK